MKLSRIVVPCMALLLAAAPSLRADTVAVSVWNVPVAQVPGGIVPAPGSSFYSNPTTATYLVSNASGSIFNFASSAGPVPTNYTIDSFLKSDAADTVTLLTGSGAADLNDPVSCFLNCTTSTIFRFVGLYNGGAGSTNVTINSDDGVILFDVTTNSILCSNSAPQSNAPTACVIPGGPQILNLYYGEVEGPPADLNSLSLNLQAVPTTPTPEPSSIALFGTGLLAAAGLVRRRLFS
jgi:PEP-CTERM motif